MSDTSSVSPRFIPIESQSVHTSCGIDGHCITCSDEAVTVTVVSVDDATGMALVSVENVTEEVDITLIETVVVGDNVLVHGGVAIAHLGKE
jgi:hydrogenase maturation factor